MINTENVLYIKNMVCPRCIKVVKEELEKLNIEILDITLGEVKTKKSKDQLPIDKIRNVLDENGFELIDDKNSRLVENIKKEIILVIQNFRESDFENINFPKLLTDSQNKEYHYLSSLFSKTEGITIEHFIILQKIEKVKELLKYDELTLSEIAYQLGYSSVQHLSRKKKKTTGLTASEFKSNLTVQRKPIDSLT